MIKQSYTSIIQVGYVTVDLNVYSAISGAHSEFTRYPNDGKYPLLYYTKKSPVISLQLDFMNHF